MAELELRVLDGQCLNRRLPSLARVCQEVAPWEAARNTGKVAVKWQLTVAKARTTLPHLYPPVIWIRINLVIH
jgi:hypothetical protein